MSTERYLGRKPNSPEEDDHNKELFEKGLSIHSDADIRSILRELTKEILAGNFRDVQIFNPSLSEEDDATSISSSWNIRKSSYISLDPSDIEMLRDRVSIDAYPETGDLVVRGREEKRIENGVWRSDSKVLRDAIRIAIQNPMTISSMASTL